MINTTNYGINPYDTAATAAFAGFGMGYLIVSLAIAILMIVSMWKLFTKAGKPGWASIIPIYNIIVMLQIAGMNPLMILLMLVPIANVVVMILMYVKLAEAFGKSGAYAVGLIFLNVIFLPMLAFGDAEYQGE